jgi:hypothetical protein
MSLQYVFHGPVGRSDFLGLRRSRRGHLEIVYDDGGHRTVMRVEDSAGTGDATAARVGEALKAAMNRARVLTALHSELVAREIRVEMLGRE